MRQLHNHGAAKGAGQQQNYDMYGPHRFRPTQQRMRAAARALLSTWSNGTTVLVILDTTREL
jgi:hypothetical protein